jgi:glyoxylase-like metal-dependent hydrolase (beta-lactamase superfamily II)
VGAWAWLPPSWSLAPHCSISKSPRSGISHDFRYNHLINSSYLWKSALICGYPLMLSIETLVLGPVQTNAYLIADPDAGIAVVIDPAWDGHLLLDRAARRGWRIANLWLTHAHFDHFGGAGAVADGSHPAPFVALHPADYPLWRAQGGAPLFGFHIDPGPEPSVDLFQGQVLHLGRYDFEIRHVPGHSPGHVLFYCAQASAAFCGDVIFQGSIGRTDLPGGDYDTLMASIHTQVLTLPDNTCLYSGHGPVTTPAAERLYNPFLRGL